MSHTAALQRAALLPAPSSEAVLIHRVGRHELLRLTAKRMVLVGPDDFTDLSWADPFLVGWTCHGYDSVDDTLITHFVLL